MLRWILPVLTLTLVLWLVFKQKTPVFTEKTAPLPIETIHFPSNGSPDSFARAEECLRKKDRICAETEIRALLASEPENPFLHLALGQILLSDENYEQALPAFQKAKKFGAPDSLTEPWIRRAEQLQKESEQLGVLRSPHFELLFENGNTLSASDPVFEILENAYDSLCLLWNYYPEKTIGIVLYESREYEGANPKPEWSSAVYDGKLRIPLRIFDTEAPKNILIHELSHAFVRELAGGKAPVWLDEGIAQITDGTKVQLNGLSPPPLSLLEKPFMKQQDIKTVEALYAYSLAMTEILFRKAESFERLGIFLQQLKSGSSLRETLEKNFGTSPEVLLAETENLL